MNDSLFASLKEIEYKTKIKKNLKTYSLKEMLNNNLNSKASFILATNKDEYAFSQWVSPKRTRSFPYSRVYDTLIKKNRITLIPFCKDEGADGDRDFIQWDTISLMSLLNVYVIIGYYNLAEKNQRILQKHKNKIANQVYDYQYVKNQIEKLQDYQSSPLHWNLKQIELLPKIAQLTLESYQKISQEIDVQLHGEYGIRKRIKILEKDTKIFKDYSRELAKQAQYRENLTIQPKEKITVNKKKIILKNLLGGYYFLTIDECILQKNQILLIEKKHSENDLIPSSNDIKDACIKMVLFTNIEKLEYQGKQQNHQALVGLTSKTIQGYMHSKMSDAEINNFFRKNNFSVSQEQIFISAIEEARLNKFILYTLNSNEEENQEKIFPQ